MAKCPKCGAELDGKGKFCTECGAEIPRDKECPSCHARCPIAAKFCAECGFDFMKSNTPAAGVAVGIGDKNVIAGDVSLSNTTNTTNYINQDETRRVVKCAACGKSIVITEAFTCVDCGEYVCEDHYDKAHRKCTACHAKQVESAESKYRAKLDVILEDGIVDADEFGQLECIRKELGISSARSMELMKQAKAARLAKMSARTADTPLMTVEKAQCERARQILFENGNAQEAVALLESIHQNHPVNENVLEVFLTALQMFDVERARKIIGELPVDLVIAYLTLVDLELRKGDLAEAERKLAAAEKLWPDSNLVKYRRVALMYATARELDNRTFLVEAMDILTSIPEPTDKMEKSWGFYLQYLISKELGDEVPVLNKAFCQEQGVYYALASGKIMQLCGEEEHIPVEEASVDTATVDNAVVVSADGNADYATIEDAVEHVQEGGIVVVKSGTYKESFVLKKNVSIVGHAGSDVVVESKDGEDCSIRVATDATFRNVAFNIPSAREEDEPCISLGITSGKIMVESCRFEGYGVGILAGEDSNVTLLKCDFKGNTPGAVVAIGEASLLISDTRFFRNTSNIVIDENAKVKAYTCSIGMTLGAGVVINRGACVLENCEIDECIGASGIEVASKEANVTVRKCTIKGGEKSVHIKGGYERSLKSNQCSEFNFVYKNDELFRFENDGAGTCRIVGPTSYNFNKTQNIIKAARFNNDAKFHSGDLYVTLWLSKSRYTGGQLDGIAVAEGYLGALTDGYGYPDKVVQCERLVGYRQASGGDYYPVIAVNELTIEPDGTEHRYIIGWVCYDKMCHWS